MSKKIDVEQQRRFNAMRCPTCGKFHPFIKICPYVQSVRVEQIRDLKNPGIRGRITTTEYFHRPELMLTAVESLEEAEMITNDPSNQ